MDAYAGDMDPHAVIAKLEKQLAMAEGASAKHVAGLTDQYDALQSRLAFELGWVRRVAEDAIAELKKLCTTKEQDAGS